MSAEWLKSLKFCGPVRGPSILVTQIFVIFYLFLIFAKPENFMCLASVVRKFEFRGPRLRGRPPFRYPQIVSNFIFFYISLPQKFHVSSLKH